MPRFARGHCNGMLLVLGLRATVRVLARLVGSCGRCGNRGPHEVVESVRKFTFFFVPLFRVGAARYFQTCTNCGLETPLTEAQARSTTPSPHMLGPQDAPRQAPQDRR